jgi:hypothetical protein
MVEAVVAVLENKASIGSRDKLQGSLDNIRCVKVLDLTNGARTTWSSLVSTVCLSIQTSSSIRYSEP